MSRTPLHALIWSKEQSLYELYTQGQLQQRFRPAEQSAWLAWLGSVSSFAFHGASGSLNVYLEARPRGGAYWYAYHTSHGRTRKRYLGQRENLSLAHLEETAQTLLRERQPAQELDQGWLLLSSRFTPPLLPNSLVARKHLLAALDRALATPLTLLSAPAGFGKTTLLAAWASQRKMDVAWLSLDELDNSPTHFWVTLIAALRCCASLTPHLGETALVLLQSPQPPPLSTMLTALLQELESREAHPAPIILVVDDYQMIEEQAIHESLSLFLEHLPAHLHLILASRVDPDLPLARLRVRGQLTEIRADELRFRGVEAGQYLGRMLSPPLSEEEVSRLVSRTEGWIAGLQLAALALQKRVDRAAFLQAFTGSQRYLLDYVQQDILARLPTPVRDFLLHTAILSRLDASVCQAVGAVPTQAASQQMLTFLERANLFLVPLDEERRIFRLHGLFREALLACLHSTQPEMEPLLHRRAASFYEAQEQWAEAIVHALQATDFSTAARLMEQTVEQFWVRGEAATIARWVLALPQALVREHARLLLTTALYLLNTIPQATREQRERCYQQARQLMARVETVLPPQTDKTSYLTAATRAGTGAVLPLEGREARAAEEALLQRRLRLLRLFIVASEALATGEHERLSALQQEIQEELDQDEEAIWQMVPLVCSFALHFSVRQEGEKLLPRLLEAKRQASRETSRFASLKVRQWLALVVLEVGKLRQAYEESQAALDLIEQIAGYTPLKGYFQLVQIYVLYQWNRLEEARGLLHTALHDASTWQHLDVLGSGYIYLMQVELARGEWSAAQQALHEVEQLVQRERYRPYIDWLYWWLVQGRLKEASNWAAGVVFPGEAWEGHLDGAFPVMIRGYFAQHRWREALELLERWSGHLDRPTNIQITLMYLAQLLVALHQTGKSEQAREIAARLFSLTEPEGYIRVYLDEGEPMRQALQALLTLHSQPHELPPSTTAYVAKILVAFEQEEQGASISPTVPPPAGPAPSVPDASLTRREQEVLRLLAAGASNQEIAQTLVISQATVKKHVSNLLGKLGVTRRTQAMAQARARSLL